VQNSSFETFGLAVCEALSAGSELLIAKNVGAISVIDNLTEKNIINSPDDIDEIAKKISYFVKYRGGTQLRFAKASHWRDSFGRLMFEIGHSDNA
jgi:glycosyltransferase involved in cell wall biosynthesis